MNISIYTHTYKKRNKHHELNVTSVYVSVQSGSNDVNVLISNTSQQKK